jgi:hypothetical protein
MKWRIECKYTGKGEVIDGTLDAAIQNAKKLCRAECSTWVVWLLPANLRMVDVQARGCCWSRRKLGGKEVQSLMRRHHKTIAGLARQMQVTQKRVRYVREHGILNALFLRDWLEAIIDEDVGPLPERQFIRVPDERCSTCNDPLTRGRLAYQYGGDAFCSVECCRSERGWGDESVRSHAAPDGL